MASESEPNVFVCSVCGFSSPYTLHGSSLSKAAVNRGPEEADGAGKVVFMEDAYLLPDPNAVQIHPLCLGSHCTVCGCMVCTGDSCSLFYAKRFCARCARENKEAFPIQCIKLAPKIFAEAASK